MRNLVASIVSIFRPGPRLQSPTVLGSVATIGPPVLVRFGESRQLGFLVETTASDDHVVFIPDAPDVSNGSVHIVYDGQIERLLVPRAQATGCLMRLGKGLAALAGTPPR